MADEMEAFNEGHESGWNAALLLYGLRDCTIRNNGEEIMRVPLKGQLCYIELDPGQEASLRTVE